MAVDSTLCEDVATRWFVAMRRGEWEQAWRETDRIELTRRKRQALGDFAPQAQHLLWDGSPFEGRSVLIRCNHGLGDSLQFIRFVPWVSRMARQVSLLVQPQLLPLLADAPGLGDVRNAWTDDPAPEHDVAVELMELPYALRLGLQSLPPPYPHLRQQLAGVQLSIDLPRDSRLRVGLLWAASDWDTSRSVSLAALAPLMRMPHLQFFSLQQGSAASDPLLASCPIIALSAQTVDVRSAAQAMLQMDLVISVDGMPAHLAASLGRPTWLMLKHQADWRWMEERSDSPWYPSMRLFRQPSPGDWDSVITQVAQALQSSG